MPNPAQLPSIGRIPGSSSGTRQQPVVGVGAHECVGEVAHAGAPVAASVKPPAEVSSDRRHGTDRPGSPDTEPATGRIDPCLLEDRERVGMSLRQARERQVVVAGQPQQSEALVGLSLARERHPSRPSRTSRANRSPTAACRSVAERRLEPARATRRHAASRSLVVLERTKECREPVGARPSRRVLVETRTSGACTGRRPVRTSACQSA